MAETAGPPDQAAPGAALRRRTFLTLLGAGAVGAAAGAGVATAARSGGEQSDAIGSQTVPFYGEHQAGIATPAPARAELAAFDLREGTGIGEVREVLQTWTALAAALTQGQEHPADPIPQLASPPSGLTLTVGFGPRFFDVIGRPEARPAGVAQFPPFAKDELEDRYSGGDILVQACAEDAVAVSHAIDAMRAAAAGAAAVRWRQTGFQRTPGVAGGQTPRNLMGSKDGTANDPPGSAQFATTVWASGTGYPGWFLGGTTMVVRRIRMDLDSWGAADVRTRERTIGRHLDSGAPLGEDDEFAPVPLNAQAAGGQLQIPGSAHVRVAHPDTNAGARMFRRGYNYSEAGESGLLFIAVQADATHGFIPVMSRMASSDDLNRFVTHTGSAVFALPPGVQEGQYWGQSLLG